jgi:hypothetical protein
MSATIKTQLLMEDESPEKLADRIAKLADRIAACRTVNAGDVGGAGGAAVGGSRM